MGVPMVPSPMKPTCMAKNLNWVMMNSEVRAACPNLFALLEALRDLL